MAKKKTRAKRRRARPLLVAAVGAVLLTMGCEDLTSGNLIAPVQDLSVPDQPPDLSKRD